MLAIMDAPRRFTEYLRCGAGGLKRYWGLGPLRAATSS